VMRRLVMSILSAFRRSARPPFIHPLDPRDERELELLRQRRELRQRAASDQDDGGASL